jgi:hypothetical protein
MGVRPFIGPSTAIAPGAVNTAHVSFWYQGGLGLFAAALHVIAGMARSWSEEEGSMI